MNIVGPAREHRVLYPLDEPLFDGIVRQWVGGHVEQKEVLLFSCAHTFLNKILGQSFSHIAELIPKFERVPGLSFKTKNI